MFISKQASCVLDASTRKPGILGALNTVYLCLLACMVFREKLVSCYPYGGSLVAELRLGKQELELETPWSYRERCSQSRFPGQYAEEEYLQGGEGRER